MRGTGGWGGGCQYIVKLSILGLRHPPPRLFSKQNFPSTPPPRIFSRLAHAYSLYKKIAFETEFRIIHSALFVTVNIQEYS